MKLVIEPLRQSFELLRQFLLPLALEESRLPSPDGEW
jgi:hypothetical protein